MITLDADTQSAGAEGFSWLPEHSIQINDSFHQVENIDIAAIDNPPIEKVLNVDVFANEQTVQGPIQTTEWGRSLENEFNDLAEKEALDKASDKEMQRLEDLSLLRSRLCASLSAEQIFFLYKLQKREEKLLHDLSEYVSFIKASHR